MFSIFKKAGSAVVREVSAEYGSSKDFLEGVVAAAALVAYADGELEDSERTKIVSIITGHAELGRLYDRAVIEKTVDDMFRRAKDRSGRQALGRELDDVVNKPNSEKLAEDIYLIADDIAHADGELDDKEKDVLAKIANALRVDPSKFQF